MSASARRVGATISEIAGTLAGMTATRTGPGRPHMGDRHVVTSRVPIPVRDALEQLAERFGTDRSTVLADLAAAAVGRPELARRVRFTAAVDGEIVPDGGLPLAM